MAVRFLMPVHSLRLIFPPSFIKCLPLASILQESGQYLSFQNMQQPSPPQFSVSTLLVHGHSTYCIKLQAFVCFSVSFSGPSSLRTGSLTLITLTYSKSQPLLSTWQTMGKCFWNNGTSTAWCQNLWTAFQIAGKW